MHDYKLKRKIKVHLSGATSGIDNGNHSIVARQISDDLNNKYMKNTFIFIWDGDSYNENGFTGLIPYLQYFLPNSEFIAMTENPSETFRGDWSPIKSWMNPKLHNIPNCGIKGLDNAKKGSVVKFDNSVVIANGQDIKIKNLTYKILSTNLDDIMPEKMKKSQYSWLQYLNMN